MIDYGKHHHEITTLEIWKYGEKNINKPDTAFIEKYRKVSNIRRTIVGNKIVDHSDVVGASLNTWLQWIGQRQLQDKTRNMYVLGLGSSYIVL